METCRVTGTVLNPDGSGRQYVKVYVTRVVKGGVLISSVDERKDTDAAGVFYFDLPRGALVTFKSDGIEGLTGEKGATVLIPDEATATLESLLPARTFTAQGVTAGQLAEVQASLSAETDARSEADAETLASARAYTDAATAGIDLSAYQTREERNAANGYAGLDSSGLIPDNRLPASIARDSEVSGAVAAEAAARAAADGTLASAIDAQAAALEDLDAEVGTKAPIDSPTFTGTPTAPTPSEATSNTQLATTAHVHAVVASILGTPPSTLDTLAEIAAALGNDPNLSATLTTLISLRLLKSANLSDLTDVATARSNLGFDAAVDSRISDAIGATVQASNGMLDELSNIAGSNGDVIQKSAGIWTNRTPSQLKSMLALTKSDVGLSNVQNNPVASQAEAEAGTASDRYMTPERTAQAVAALAGGGSAVDVQVFTANGTWTKPSGAKLVRVIAIGGGGGGGSGRRGAAGTARAGGGGGSGAAYSLATFLASNLTATVTVTIGQGGGRGGGPNY